MPLRRGDRQSLGATHRHAHLHNPPPWCACPCTLDGMRAAVLYSHRAMESEPIAEGKSIPATSWSAPRSAARWTHAWVPLLALAVALPLTLYAGWQSTAWLDRLFPGFLVMQNGVIPTIGTSNWPADSATLFHSEVVAVDGVPTRGGAAVLAAIASRSEGEPVRYTLRKHADTRDVVLPILRFTWSDYLQIYGILMLFGCANLLTGVVVGFLQPRTLQARVFVLHTTIAGLYAVSAVFLHQPQFDHLNRLCLAAESFVSATFLHLALTFPVPRRLGRSGSRAWLILPYLLSAGLFFFVLGGFDAQPPQPAPMQVSYLYTAACLAFFLGTLGFAYFENRDGRIRARIKAVLPGAILAVTVQFFVFVNNSFAGGDIPVQFGLLTPIPYYLGLAYAIAKYDLFDIDRVVRLSFVYAVLSIIVVGAYALVLQLPALLYPSTVESQAVLGILFVLALAFAFDPLRQGVQRVVDRAFYRKRLDYRATIGELTAALTTLLDVREVLAQVTKVVADAMQLESVSIGWVDEEQSTAWQQRGDAPLLPGPEPGLVPLTDLLSRQPHTFSAEVLVRERPDIEAVLARLGAVIVLPLRLRGRVNGVLALGPKRSGQPFDSEAIDLLRTLANQTAIAVQNARSYEAVQGLNRDLDAKVRQRTRQLHDSNEELARAYDELKSAQAQLVQSEKMASLGQLVAGVAHELNNPASFIHGGLANLADFVGRLVRVLDAYEQSVQLDAQQAQRLQALAAELRLDYLRRETPELLRVCFEGSERINRIVEDLRLFARADTGDRQLIQVCDGIESSIRLLSHQLSRGPIELVRQYAETPRVLADASQLNRVWMNLLSNAIDAVEGRANPRIVVATRISQASAAPPAIEVSVSDNGPGIDPGIAARIFEPFFSTKPIGKGTGLGLSIAYGALKSHGGTIHAEPAPGGGASIVVHLPLGDGALARGDQ